MDSYYTFKTGAPLKNYIETKTKQPQQCYTLTQLLTILKQIISDESLFDPRNPAIILCSKDLEAALNMRALHVTEIKQLVATQLNHPDYDCPILIDLPQVQPVPTDNELRPGTETYELRPDFRDAMATMPDFDKSKVIYSYEEVTNLLSKYIISNKNSLFDTRNVKVVLVKNDPLGKAFQVDAFHRTQVISLLRKQITPV